MQTQVVGSQRHRASLLRIDLSNPNLLGCLVGDGSGEVLGLDSGGAPGGGWAGIEWQRGLSLFFLKPVRDHQKRS